MVRYALFAARVHGCMYRVPFDAVLRSTVYLVNGEIKGGWYRYRCRRSEDTSSFSLPLRTRRERTHARESSGDDLNAYVIPLLRSTLLDMSLVFDMLYWIVIMTVTRKRLFINIDGSSGWYPYYFCVATNASFKTAKTADPISLFS